MKQNLELGIELWAKLAEVINEESVAGEMQKNSHRLWRGYLNKWTNTEIFNILAAVSLVQEARPEMFQKFHNTALAEAAKILVRDYKMNPRCLDTKSNKDVYWRLAMTLREVWNQVSADAAEPQNLILAQ
jgi:hypothetical protein